MSFSSLSEWLAWQETLHPNPIDLGLSRLNAVLERLHWRGFECPVITISGTKGKGSCAAILESVLSAAGYRVGLFTSPHLRRYNERIRIVGQEISDASLCAIFERIDAARGEISLTYFEFNALAAFLAFATAHLDAVILEVGMGGRLDAANAIDADVAVITSIGLDHCEWLGYDLESIGREKAGIMRAGRPAIFGSLEMPVSIAETAAQLGAPLLKLGRDFNGQINGATWDWHCGSRSYAALPRPALAGDIQVNNAATALTALNCLSARLPVARSAIEQGLEAVRLQGRFQVTSGPVEWVLDVAHNAMSAQTLAGHLAHLDKRKTIAVFAALADKDLAAMVESLRTQVDLWVPAGVASPRALPVQTLTERLGQLNVNVASGASSVREACIQAAGLARPGDRVLVFGSFLVVGPALDWLGL
jgi:dihydrofolate synthase/folylpolyglutamate synthase